MVGVAVEPEVDCQVPFRIFPSLEFTVNVFSCTVDVVVAVCVGVYCESLVFGRQACRLAECGDSLKMTSQDLPLVNLGIGELSECAGDLG